MKVLVVEDNPLNMELVTELLNAQGFITDGAKDGEEAVQKAEKDVYDLIVMDIGLPCIDGVEATKRIRTKSRNKFVPVIALTAFAMKGDRDRFIKSGFDAYLSKPINVPEFMKVIGKYKE
ncbi:MAG: response regulator [Candidatus Methanoperedens sp.]